MIHRLRDELRKLFFLTRSEANGYVVLLILMAIILLSPLLFDFFVPNKPFQTAEQEAKTDSLIIAWENNLEVKDTVKISYTAEFKAAPFSKSFSSPTTNKKSKEETSKKELDNSYKPFDLNKTDTSTLQKIYGIGPVLSVRIIKFRDKLGGFYKKEQLYEVYGLDSSTVQLTLKRCFIAEDFEVKKIHLNTADFKTINAHPYISYEQTIAIVNYRRKHEAFNLVNDLLQNGLLDETTYDKVISYLIL